MKKLTAGILASLIGLVSANSAEAAVASTSYVDAGLATKQQKLTSENFKKDTTGKFVTGVTVDADGNVTFTSEDQAAAVYDATWNPTSTNAVQAQVIAGRIAQMASNTVEANKVVKSVTQEQGKITPVYGQVTGADIAAETIETGNIKDGTIATGDIADGAVTSEKIASVTMTQVSGLDTALAGKQATLTNTTNAGDGITIDDTTGKISADITQTEFDTALGNKQNTLTAGANIQIAADGTISATDTTYSTATSAAAGLTKLYAETGAAEDGTMTQKAITTELGKKQNALTAGDFINIDQATGTITTTYSAGTGIKIGTDGAISADNQLNGVTGTTVEGNVGAQVLTRTCTNENDPTTCTYVWESVDRTFGD